MSEQEQQIETTSAPDAPDLDAMAAAVMGLDMPADEPDDEPDDGEEEVPDAAASSEGDDDAETADDGDAEEETAEAAPGDEDDPNKPSEARKDESRQKKLDRLFAAARKKQKEAERREQELAQREQHVQAKAQAVQDAAAAFERFQSDPIGGFMELATKAGLDPGRLVRDLAERQLSGESEPTTAAEIQRRQWEEWKRSEEQRRQQDQERQAQMEADQKFRNLCAVQANEDLAKRWPHTASMHPAEFQRQVAEAVLVSQQAAAKVRNGKATTEDVRLAAYYQNEALMLDELEKLAEARYNHQQERIRALRPSAGSEGEAAPKAAKSGTDPRKRSRGKSRTLTNDDTAQSSGATKPMSEAARRRKAEELAKELLF